MPTAAFDSISILRNILSLLFAQTWFCKKISVIKGDEIKLVFLKFERDQNFSYWF